MKNIEEDEQKNKVKDDFLMENLPGVNDMLSKTLPNKDLLYYPFNPKQSKFLDVFDFTYTKKGGENEEFTSTDKNAPQNKSKKMQNQKYQKYNQNKNRVNQGNKNYSQTNQQRFNITQSIQPDSTWGLIKDFNKLNLEKLVIDNTTVKVKTKAIYGNIYTINESFEEEVSPYNPKLLKRYENMKFYGNTNTPDDKELLSMDESVNIYTTDKILAVIMTCVYNAHPWHLKIKKLGDKIFIEKMDNSEIDLVTVNESDNTSTIYDDSNINSYKNLNIEATLINEFVKEQILDINEESKLENTEPNPFKDEDTDDNLVEHLGYVYRLWNLDGIKILVRSQVHAYNRIDVDESKESEENEEKEDEEEEEEEKEEENEKNKGHEFINIFALNEFDKNTYLNGESNLGASILKKELKNNYLKLVKWGILSYLGGVKKLKIAFVTRKDIKNNHKHVISTIYNLGTDDLLLLTNFSKNIAWGIFKEIISLIQNYKEDGSFILMKTFGETSAKSLLKLFKVPDSYFKIEEENE